MKRSGPSKLAQIICSGCGELYSLKEFSEENPLEVCGECGAEFFIPYSKNCFEGYKSLEHYCGLLNLLPIHLRESLPPHLYPQLSPL
jgi:hypothetical protein